MKVLIVLVVLAVVVWWTLRRMRGRAQNVDRIPAETGLPVHRSPNVVQDLLTGSDAPQRTALVPAGVAGYPAWFAQLYDVQSVGGQSRRHYYPQLTVAVDWVGPSITIRRRGTIGWAVGGPDTAQGAVPTGDPAFDSSYTVRLGSGVDAAAARAFVGSVVGPDLRRHLLATDQIKQVYSIDSLIVDGNPGLDLSPESMQLMASLAETVISAVPAADRYQAAYTDPVTGGYVPGLQSDQQLDRQALAVPAAGAPKANLLAKMLWKSGR